MAYETNGLNGSNTGPIHFTNVRILDATGEYSYTGEVVIQGNRIKQITRGSSRLAPATGTSMRICICPGITLPASIPFR